jgi:hypothetical protein
MPFGTNTADVERVSDKAFERDLNAFLNGDAAAELQAEVIELQACNLILPGQDFYPWTYTHFEEAIGNAPDGDLKAVFASVAAAVDLQLNNQYSNHLALAALQVLVERYWYVCAKHEAEKN